MWLRYNDERLLELPDTAAARAKVADHVVDQVADTTTSAHDGKVLDGEASEVVVDASKTLSLDSACG